MNVARGEKGELIVINQTVEVIAMTLFQVKEVFEGKKEKLAPKGHLAAQLFKETLEYQDIR